MATAAAPTDLLNTYSLSEIIFILTVVAGSLMGAGRFFEWAYSHLKTFFGKELTVQKKEENLAARLEKIETRITDEENNSADIATSLGLVEEKLGILIESDKDRIKAYITDKHHYYMFNEGWIDDYQLDCIERQYVHYKRAGGNSFVDHLMEELRKLPTRPPEKE